MQRLFLALALLAAAPQPSGWAEPPPSREDIRAAMREPQNRLEHYSFDARRPMEARVSVCPYFLLRALREMDGRPDYKAYTLTPAERELFLGYLKELPGGMLRTFREGVVGIYFVRNFAGNGLTSWVSDGGYPRHAYIILNPEGFQRTLSETLSARDASVFKGTAAVRVDAGSRYKGVFYSLLHEGTHACDYIRGLTPWVEDFLPYAFRDGKGADDSWDVWKSYAQPRKEADYPLRERLRFYGLGGGPLLETREAARLYQGLAASPFVSLYGSRSWAEDAAELVVFYHLNKILRQPYALLVGEGKNVFRVEPLRSPKVLRRAVRVYRALGP